MKKLNFKDFAEAYCETQESTPEKLCLILAKQAEKFKPHGWFLARCIDMCSSRLGNQIILVYGPNNTYKTAPENQLIYPHEGSACAYELVATLAIEDFNAR